MREGSLCTHGMPIAIWLRVSAVVSCCRWALRLLPPGALRADSVMLTSSWQPYVKNFAPNLTFDYGGRVAALWLDR
jgi:hypothetical protein